MRKEQGIAHILLLILLLAGIVAGVYLVQNKTNLFSRASASPIVFKSTTGQALPKNSSGVPQTTSPKIKIELTSTLGAPVFATPTPINAGCPSGYTWDGGKCIQPLTTGSPASATSSIVLDDGRARIDISNLAKAVDEKAKDQATQLYNYPYSSLKRDFSNYMPYRSQQGHFCVKLSFDNTSAPGVPDKNWTGQYCPTGYLVFITTTQDAESRLKPVPSGLPAGFDPRPAANKSFLNVKAWTLCAPLKDSNQPFCVSSNQSSTTSPLVPPCDTLWAKIRAGSGSECGSSTYAENQAGDIDNDGGINVLSSDDTEFSNQTREGQNAQSCKLLLEDPVNPCAGKNSPPPKTVPDATSSATGRALGITTSVQTSGTVSYKIAENPVDLNSAPDQAYTKDPMVVDYTFKDSKLGPKFIWAEFKDNLGKTDRRSAQIEIIKSTPSPTPFVCTACNSDVKKDGYVNGGDVSYLIGCYNKKATDKDRSGKPCSDRDINGNGVVDGYDFSCIRTVFNQKCQSSPTPTPTPTPQVAKRVFVTSTTYNGNLGGLSGADAKCQERAKTANLGGTWKAWLSSDNVSAASRLSPYKGPYKSVDGAIVANNWTDLTDGFLATAINVTERNTLSNSGWVWTNSISNGSIRQTTGNSCLNWTSTSSGGGTGDSRRKDSGWSDYGASACYYSRPLYCFEQ